MAQRVVQEWFIVRSAFHSYVCRVCGQRLLTPQGMGPLVQHLADAHAAELREASVPRRAAAAA
jgi:hypothetical protein